MARKKKTPRGLHQDRLKPDRCNPREVAFIEQWEQEHAYSDLLHALLRVPCDEDDPELAGHCGMSFKLPIGEPTQRDRVIAATAIQWLGSACGISFVHDALRRVGLKIVDVKGRV